MTFRVRLTVLVAAAVAVAIVGASVVVYYTDRSQLMSQVDSDLSTTLKLPPLSVAYSRVAPGKLPGKLLSIPPGRVRSSFRARRRRYG